MDTLPHEVQVYEYVKTIERLKKQNQNSPLFSNEIQKLEAKLDQLKKKVYSNLTPWERVQICRHPSRPHTVDYIKHMTDSFTELKGDRLFAEDEAIIGGLGMIGGERVMIIGQEKGCDTESRVKRNFGMLQPEGFRKALRLMKLAEKFKIPVISLLDTPGAFPGLEAEERGQGRAIAHNLMEMAQIKTPIIVIVIGEGCSGGALGMGIGDVVAMLEHSYYSVISPEGCASILFKDAQKNKEAAEMLKLNAENLLELGVIDHIIEEPLGGAHHNLELACQNVKEFFLDQLVSFKRIPEDLLLEQRYAKFRKMGQYETTSENDSKD